MARDPGSMKTGVERRAAPGIEAPRSRVREEDLEPHAGLRYIARLFKALAILMLLVLVAEVIIGLVQGGVVALSTVMIEATRLLVFAAFLWAAGDIALMLIESNHDLRATRILVGRLNSRVEALDERLAGRAPPAGERGPPPGTP